VSSDGRNIALGIRTGGEGVRLTRIIDLSDGTLRAELPKGAIRGFGFLPDSEGFMYSLDPIGNDGHRRTARSRTAHIHYFANDANPDCLIFCTEAAENLRLISGLHHNSSSAIHTVIRTNADGNLSSIHLQHLSDPALPVLTLKEENAEEWETRISGDFLYIFMDRKTSTPKRLVRIPLGIPDLSRVQEILVEGSPKIQSWHIFGNHLVITTAESISSVLRILTIEGVDLGCIALPGPGTARVVGGDNKGCFYTFESYVYPPAIYWFSFLDRRSERFDDSPAPGCTKESHEVIVRRINYLSKDLNSIALSLLGKREVLESGSAPVLLTAYGAAGVSLTPQYSCLALSFVELGGVFAIAHVRGGGEQGTAWSEAGRRHQRPTVHSDFIAATEFLACSGIGDRDRIAIVGGSNGGLLVLTAMTKRPELFRAVVCIAPFADMLRYHLFDNTQFYVPQFGSAEDPEDFSVLLSYSPYHNVRSGVVYPPLLMVSGDADTRCDPMHAKKFVACTRSAMSSLPMELRESHPILLDWNPLRGHSGTLPLSIRKAAMVDRLAFLCHYLQIEV
jgi:prolyl oligopeptidase